jgi:ankyrin repeat protein
MKVFLIGLLIFVSNGYAQGQVPAAVNLLTAANQCEKGAENDNLVDSILHQAGVDINRREEGSGMTALMKAASKGCINTVQKLLSRRAEVNVRDSFGGTALIYASGPWGNKEVIDALLKAGARINEQDSEGKNPLMTAVIYSNFEAVKRLLDEKPDMIATDKEKHNVFDHAAACNGLKNWERTEQTDNESQGGIGGFRESPGYYQNKKKEASALCKKIDDLLLLRYVPAAAKK